MLNGSGNSPHQPSQANQKVAECSDFIYLAQHSKRNCHRCNADSRTKTFSYSYFTSTKELFYPFNLHPHPIVAGDVDELSVAVRVIWIAVTIP